MTIQALQSKPDINWLDFWFDIPLFLHSSWYGDLNKDTLIQIQLKSESLFAKRFIFGRFCKLFDLSENLNTEPNETEQFWIGVIARILSDPEPWLRCAGIITSSQPAGLVHAYMPQQTVPIILEHSVLIQLVSGLQFHIRTQKMKFKSEREAGLWLLWLALEQGQHSIWRRFRLTQPKEDIVELELGMCADTFPQAMQRNALRAWRKMSTSSRIGGVQKAHTDSPGPAPVSM